MRIDKITFQSVIPQAFAEVPDLARTSQFWDHDIALLAGKRYMIEAASGTGKSSLCSFAYGLRADYSGSILFNGKDIKAFAPQEWSQIRSQCIAMMPQDLKVFPELTAIENIRLKNSITKFLSEKEIEQMLQRLGIADKANALCGRMSIGQQQRVALVRALCQPFSFIFLDEPVSHLDETNNRIAAEIVSEQASRQNAAIVCTSVGNPLLLPGELETISL